MTRFYARERPSDAALHPAVPSQPPQVPTTTRLSFPALKGPLRAYEHSGGSAGAWEARKVVRVQARAMSYTDLVAGEAAVVADAWPVLDKVEG
jgi:hypothetical protein